MLYTKAADQGDPWAQNNLGFIYSHGKGTEVNQALASQWYRKAAQQGHFQAQFNIAARYARGEGCDPNLVESHFWFSRAQFGASALNQERAKKALEQLEENMSEEEISLAQRRFKTFVGEG